MDLCHGAGATVAFDLSRFFAKGAAAMPKDPLLPESQSSSHLSAYGRKGAAARSLSGFPARWPEVEAPNRPAELFYLQKQIQTQTPMVFILEDGERIDGCIEWYDHNSIKVRGRSRTLLYKSAIKYMYKLGENG